MMLLTSRHSPEALMSQEHKPAIGLMTYQHGQRVRVAFNGIVEAQENGLVVMLDDSGPYPYRHYLPSKHLSCYDITVTRPLLDPGMVLRTPSGNHWFVRDSGAGNYIHLSPVHQLGADLEIRDFWMLYPTAEIVYDPKEDR